jgi:hypothetical protein
MCFLLLERCATGRLEAYRTLRYRTGRALQDGWKPTERYATGLLVFLAQLAQLDKLETA